MKICKICRRKIEIKPGGGWLHKGGGNIWVRCVACGYEGSEPDAPIRCPRCESVTGLRDDHCVQPANY
ncbi:MAG: hypothetical protein V1759_01545 [bacterium]